MKLYGMAPAISRTLLSIAVFGVCALQAQSVSDYRGRPFLGRPQVIPGKIQAEFYDIGGQGVTYSDAGTRAGEC